MKSNVELLRKSLDHWMRMVRWVRKQGKRCYVEEAYMMESIGEIWSGTHCPCCSANNRDGTAYCPLADRDCDYFCCVSEWSRINNAPTWGLWLEYSKDMVELLRKRIRKERRKEARILQKQGTHND